MDQEMHEAPHYQAAYDARKPMSPNRAASAMLTTSPGHRVSISIGSSQVPLIGTLSGRLSHSFLPFLLHPLHFPPCTQKERLQMSPPLIKTSAVTFWEEWDASLWPGRLSVNAPPAPLCLLHPPGSRSHRAPFCSSDLPSSFSPLCSALAASSAQSMLLQVFTWLLPFSSLRYQPSYHFLSKPFPDPTNWRSSVPSPLQSRSHQAFSFSSEHF